MQTQLARGNPLSNERILALVRPYAGVIAIASIVLLPLLFSMPFLGGPMERDEGVYFGMAMFDGLPYTAVFDHKPPLVYAWYELSLLITGEPSIVAIRTLAALNLSATALAVTWCGWLLGGRRLGLLGGLAMALAVSNQYLQFEANTEVFTILPLTLSFGCFLRGVETERRHWLLLSGALLGIATMTKSVAILQYPALLFVLGSSLGGAGGEPRRLSRNALALTAGLASALALVVTPFVVSGHWHEFAYANIEYNYLYGEQVPFVDKLFAISEVHRQVLSGALWLWLLAAFGGFLVVTRRAEAGTASLLAVSVAAFVGASSTGRESPHYWVTIVPFAALLAAIAVERVMDTWHERRGHIAANALACVVLLSVLALTPLYVAGSDAAHLLKYERELGAERAVESAPIAAFIADHSEPGDRLFVLGGESQLYVLADRRPATYFTRPLAALTVDPATFERTMRELRAAPPYVFVDSARVDLKAADDVYVRTGESDLSPTYRKQIDALLSEHYVYWATIEHAEIYLLRLRPPEP